MKDEDTSRKESGAHLTSKKCIVGNEDNRADQSKATPGGNRSESVK